MCLSAARADPIEDDDRVLTFAEFCELAGISDYTRQRLAKSGDHPRITQLSERRQGIRARDYRQWLDRRVKDLSARSPALGGTS
jgi:predicted DNA-binding transcriptional regulator AlpA